MIPRIAQGGRSFCGAFAYYMHDKGAQTSERVAWTHTENMSTEDPHLACKIMVTTADAQSDLKETSGQSREGRKLEKPVFSFSLSWHPEQDPDQEHMLDTAHNALEMMGMSEHELITSNMVTRRLDKVLARAAESYRTNHPADSAKQWLELNGSLTRTDAN